MAGLKFYFLILQNSPERNTTMLLLKTTTKTKKTKIPIKPRPCAATLTPMTPLQKKHAAKQAAIQREIAKREKTFKAANLQQKRVLIAKDVIAQIKLGRIVPKTGAWLRPELTATGKKLELAAAIAASDKDKERKEFDDASLQEEILAGEKVKACTCCALVGMFLSCTLYNNNVGLGAACDITYAKDSPGLQIIRALEKPGKHCANDLDAIFTKTQLVTIEAVYELRVVSYQAAPFDCGKVLDEHNKPIRRPTKIDRECFIQDLLVRWRKKYPRSKNRLVAIMKNIIKHDGTFRPEVL